MSRTLITAILVTLCAGCASNFYDNPPVASNVDAATIKHKASSEVQIIRVNGQRVRAEDDMLRIAAGKHQFAVACMDSGKSVERNVWANIKANQNYQLAIEDASNCFTMIKQK